LSIGTLSCLFYFLLVVVRIFPWYNPQYFIPIAGMLIGNSMTGISLGVKSLMEAMTIQRAMVEEALVLGASPQAATKSIINRTFDSAILPTLNSMMGMGIIFLPGMMTGQILSGVSPLTAISYQIAIMLGILGSVSLSVILLLQWGYKTFFNKEDQLNP
jgi:putative ABC transport system permease protein